MAGRLAGLAVFDIVFNLSSSGAVQADDLAKLILVYIGHVVQRIGFGCERNHARFVVFKSVIHPY